jgi:hypothetical protein
MATHQYGADAVALDDTRVYWSTRGFGPDSSSVQGVVRSCVKTNCAGTVVTYADTYAAPGTASLAAWPGGHTVIAVGNAEIYWVMTTSSNTVIQACPIGGCADAPKVIATDVSPRDLVVDDAYAYWLSSDWTLQRCAIAGCGRSPELLTVISGGSALVQREAQLYWIASQTGPSATGAIMTLPKDGSSPARTVVDGVRRGASAEGVQMPAALAVDATNVYWLETGSLGAVKTCPRTGCVGAPMTIAAEQSFPYWLAIDAENAYWFSFQGAWWAGKDVATQLVRCPLTGCGADPVVLATNQVSSLDIALDKTHVYWSNFGASKPMGHGVGRYFDGAIMRARIAP